MDRAELLREQRIKRRAALVSALKRAETAAEYDKSAAKLSELHSESERKRMNAEVCVNRATTALRTALSAGSDVNLCLRAALAFGRNCHNVSAHLKAAAGRLDHEAEAALRRLAFLAGRISALNRQCAEIDAALKRCVSVAGACSELAEAADLAELCARNDGTACK